MNYNNRKPYPNPANVDWNLYQKEKVEGLEAFIKQEFGDAAQQIYAQFLLDEEFDTPELIFEDFSEAYSERDEEALILQQLTHKLKWSNQQRQACYEKIVRFLDIQIRIEIILKQENNKLKLQSTNKVFCFYSFCMQKKMHSFLFNSLF
jgi:hypothetical protein